MIRMALFSRRTDDAEMLKPASHKELRPHTADRLGLLVGAKQRLASEEG